MNLSKLFEIQAVLDNRIVEEHNLQGVDLLDKKILALQVELGELANEWRGFKFWKVDNEPRTLDWVINDKGPMQFRKVNPLLEEYVDCLHFILSIGLEMNIVEIKGLEPFKAKSGTTQQFNVLFKHIGSLKMQLEANVDAGYERYYHIINLFIGLGELLGFTWEQIEQAYYDKNKINHERQENGY